MAKLALIITISTALMTSVAADGLVAPELSRPTAGQSFSGRTILPGLARPSTGLAFRRRPVRRRSTAP